MIDKKVAKFQKYQENFEKHFDSVDEVGQAVLKGHLIVESVLDNLIDRILFHPNHLRQAQLTFNQKVHLARALALRKDENSIWTLIRSLNAVRNEIVHSLVGHKRSKKIDQLRRLYLAETDPERRLQHKDEPDHHIVLFACALCVGFLSAFEDDLAALRNFIDGLDKAMNLGDSRLTGS